VFLSGGTYPEIQHHDRARHAERGHFDRREREAAAGQVPLPGIKSRPFFTEVSRQTLPGATGRRAPIRPSCAFTTNRERPNIPASASDAFELHIVDTPRTPAK
ncbi:MAG: hypothetical protein ACREUB_10685, partial [Burkholderiales bacterium]